MAKTFKNQTDSISRQLGSATSVSIKGTEYKITPLKIKDFAGAAEYLKSCRIASFTRSTANMILAGSVSGDTECRQKTLSDINNDTIHELLVANNIDAGIFLVHASLRGALTLEAVQDMNYVVFSSLRKEIWVISDLYTYDDEGEVDENVQDPFPTSPSSEDTEKTT